MGGFRFNGCGATDRFKPIMELGTFVCPQCSQSAVFTLDEVRRKIDVLFIPTATISVKYAIMCKHCERGYYISEEQKNSLLSGKMTVEISGDGVELKNRQAQEVTAQPGVAEVRTAREQKSVDDAVPRFCAKCGKKQQYNALYCWSCGYKLAETGVVASIQPETVGSGTEFVKSRMKQSSQPQDLFAKASPVSGGFVRPQKKFCPKCNLYYVQSKTICSICGGTLEMR